jgi:predicted nuclease with TOPRIM domain
MPETATSKIIRLEEQMKSVENKIDDLKSTVDILVEKLEPLPRLHDRVNQLEKEILEVQRKQNFQKWLFPTLSAIAGGLFLWLIQIALSK